MAKEPRYCEWAGCVCVVCCQIEHACEDCELRLGSSLDDKEAEATS